MINYEEKYKEALAKLASYSKDVNGRALINPGDIFPELAETTDEKIRREIIEHLNWAQERGSLPNEIYQSKKVGDWIDWLERMDSRVSREDKKRFDDIRKSTIRILEKFYNTISQDDEEFQATLDSIDWLDSLGISPQGCRWKPSSDQLSALKKTINNLDATKDVHMVDLVKLYYELKGL